jgi:hypothetical protein
MDKLLEWIRLNSYKLNVEYSESIEDDADSKIFKKTYQAKINDDYYLNASELYGIGDHEGVCYGNEVEVITPKGTSKFNDTENNCESNDIFYILAHRYEDQKENIRNDFLAQLD